MREPLEDLYFNWLVSKVVRNSVSSPSLRYDTLLRTMHSTEFAWFVTGDDNRAADGKDLRTQFLLVADIPDDPEWRNYPASLLEVLVALCGRAEWDTDIPLDAWFWRIIGNLGLHDCNEASGITSEDIQPFLDDVIFRQYSEDGRGGLFPLNNPPEDQTKVELWYQFCEYLVDQENL